MGLFRDKARGDWLYQFNFQGVRYQRRGFKTREAAEIARVEHRKRLKKAPLPPTCGTGFRQVAYEYLDEAQRRFAKKTHEAKVLCYRLFFESLPSDLPIDEITAQHVNEYLKSRPSNYNFNFHRKDLHALFAFAKKRKYIRDNPVDDIEKMPHTPGRKVIPTEQQIIQLIVAAEPEVERPLFLVILHTLGRVDEVLRLTWDDVNFEKRTVTLWTRKRKGGAYESDVMPMNQDLYDVLHALFKKRTQTQWVFYNPKTGTRFNRRPKMMKGLCKRAFDPACKKLDDYTGPVFGFHTLRHFMASYMADKGKWSTKTLQRLLRHKESRTTEIYLHQLGDGLREAVKGVEGKFLVVTPGSDFDEKQAK